MKWLYSGSPLFRIPLGHSVLIIGGVLPLGVILLYVAGNASYPLYIYTVHVHVISHPLLYNTVVRNPV